MSTVLAGFAFGIALCGLAHGAGTTAHHRSFRLWDDSEGMDDDTPQTDDSHSNTRLHLRKARKTMGDAVEDSLAKWRAELKQENKERHRHEKRHHKKKIEQEMTAEDMAEDFDDRGVPYSPYMSIKEREAACKKACMRHKDKTLFGECFTECSVITDLQGHTAKHEMSEWGKSTGNYGGMEDLEPEGSIACKPLDSSELIDISFDDFDSNGDGYITPTEAITFGRVICIPDMTTLKLYRDADKNNDERVSRKEWDAAGEDTKYAYELDRLLDHLHKSRNNSKGPYPQGMLREVRPRKFESLDATGDFKLDDQEVFDNFMAELKERDPDMSPEMKQHMINMFWDNIDDVMKRLDKNVDGKINRWEFDDKYKGESWGDEMEEASPVFAEPDVTTVEPPKIPQDVEYPRKYCIAWHIHHPIGELYHFKKEAEKKFGEMIQNSDAKGVVFYDKDLHLKSRYGELFGAQWGELQDWCRQHLEEQRLTNVWGDEECDHYIDEEPSRCQAGNYRMNCAKRCAEESFGAPGPAPGSPAGAPMPPEEAMWHKADEAVDAVEDHLDEAEQQLDDGRNTSTPENLWGDVTCERWVAEEPSRCFYRNYQMNCRLACAEHHDTDWWHEKNWWYKQDYWPHTAPTTTTTSTTVDSQDAQDNGPTAGWVVAFECSYCLDNLGTWLQGITLEECEERCTTKGTDFMTYKKGAMACRCDGACTMHKPYPAGNCMGDIYVPWASALLRSANADGDDADSNMVPFGDAREAAQEDEEQAEQAGQIEQQAEDVAQAEEVEREVEEQAPTALPWSFNAENDLAVAPHVQKALFLRRGRGQQEHKHHKHDHHKNHHHKHHHKHHQKHHMPAAPVPQN